MTLGRLQFTFSFRLSTQVKIYSKSFSVAMYSYHILDLKDANGKRPLDYLISNWTETIPPLLQTTLQIWLVDRLARWGATEAMASKVQVILDEDDKEERATLCTRAYSVFEKLRTDGTHIAFGDVPLERATEQ